MSWEKKPLNEVADFCLGKMLDQNKNKGEALPYLANVNVRWGAFDFGNLREMRFEPGEIDRYGLKYGDIVMCEGGEPGRCAIWKNQIPGMMIQKALHRIRPHSCLDSSFLFYSFLKKRKNDEFSGLFTGSTIKHLPKEKLAKIKVEVPPISIQRRIVSILSPYDDLIENNRRRIALLEEAARMLYREWFVHFRFPGHEHVKIVDGLPEGWKRPAASVVMDILSGGTPKTGNAGFWDGEIGFFTPKDATDTPYVLNTEKTITEEGLRACNSKLYPTDTLFITARGTVGKLNLALIPMAMNQSCYALRAKAHFGQRYLYVALKTAIEQVRSRATGAVFDAVIVATFDRIPFLLPPEILTRSFEQSINPVFDQIANLIQQNQKLVQARDLLLPRLMNGDITV